MPYIDEHKTVELALRDPENPGELNYAISCLLANYVDDKGLSYETLNAVSGAVTEALAEFRRRLVVPYEDVKRADGGVDPYVNVRPYALDKDNTCHRAADADWPNRRRHSLSERNSV